MKKNLKISINSPVILGYVFICAAALLLSRLTHGFTNDLLFCTYRSQLTDPLTYVRAVGYIFGHVSWQHFMNNMALLLVTGPMLEEKYGSQNLIVVILITALTASLVNAVFFPGTAIIGASGVVYCFILLSSFGSAKEGTLPLTFILAALIYIGGQIIDSFLIGGDISYMGHIAGAVVGSFLGYVMAQGKVGWFRQP